MLLVAASPVFAYVFVGSSGILAPSTAHPTELNCYRVTLIQMLGVVLLGTHQSSHVEWMIAQ